MTSLTMVPPRYYDFERGVWLSIDPQADDAVRCKCRRLLFRLDVGWTCLHCPPHTKLIDDSVVLSLFAKCVSKDHYKLLRFLKSRSNWMIRTGEIGVKKLQYDARKPSTPPHRVRA